MKKVEKYWATKLPHWETPQLYADDTKDKYSTVGFTPVVVVPADLWERIVGVMEKVKDTKCADEDITRRLQALEKDNEERLITNKVLLDTLAVAAAQNALSLMERKDGIEAKREILSSLRKCLDNMPNTTTVNVILNGLYNWLEAEEKLLDKERGGKDEA